MRLMSRDGGSSAALWLSAQHRVGRSRSANLRLESPAVSAEHALIAWDGSAWLVRDLGSRNGTLLNGEKLAAQERYPLSVGDVLCFGDDTVRFEVLDLYPPVAMAEDARGSLRLSEHGILSLPNAEDAEVLIFQESDSVWLVERLDGTRAPIADQAVLSLSEGVFRIHLPEALRETEARAPLLHVDRLTLDFRVSADEEDITLRLVQEGVVRELPPRTFHYVLLVLARLRVADGDGNDEHAGWVDVAQLLRMLKTTRRQLNLAIFRARQQFADAGVAQAVDLVERQPHTDRLRLRPKSIRERRAERG